MAGKSPRSHLHVYPVISPDITNIYPKRLFLVKLHSALRIAFRASKNLKCFGVGGGGGETCFLTPLESSHYVRCDTVLE